MSSIFFCTSFSVSELSLSGNNLTASKLASSSSASVAWPWIWKRKNDLIVYFGLFLFDTFFDLGIHGRTTGTTLDLLRNWWQIKNKITYICERLLWNTIEGSISLIQLSNNLTTTAQRESATCPKKLLKLEFSSW